MMNKGVWNEDEHQRFVEALKIYPQGPWTEIATRVATRSPRQVQTHAQKYFEKMERHIRGLRRDRKPGVRTLVVASNSPGEATTLMTREHELDDEILAMCSLAVARGDRLPTPARPRQEEKQRRVARRGMRLAAGEFASESDEEKTEGGGGISEEAMELPPLDVALDFLMDCLAEPDISSSLPSHEEV